MENSIHAIPLGFDNVYVVKGRRAVIIDSGEPRKGAVFLKGEDDAFSLKEYGISGKIFYTPGHSSGSVSVLLENGEAFVGDMAMNKFPLRLSPGMPIYAENWPSLLNSWQLLIKEGAKTVYPSHGRPFSIDIIKKELAKEKSL